MKIMCQEHYDKVVQYAESIGDKTLEECLQRLERWEQNPHHPCQIELYRDFAPYSFLFKERYPDGSLALSADWFIMDVRIGRAVLSTVPFTAGRPTPEKPVIYAYENFALCCRQGQSVRRCPYHRIRPSSGSVYPICPVSAATNDERQDTTLEDVCRTKHGNCISSG